MSAKTKTETPKPTLTEAKAQRIAKIWIVGDEAAARAGGELASKIAKEACAVFERTAKPTRADAELVTRIVAKARKWSDTSINVRTSEIFTLMQARLKVPAAVVSVEKALAGVCRWGDAVNAARAINDGKDPVRFVKGKRKGGSEEPKDSAAVKKAVAIAVKKWLGWSATPKALKGALRELCSENDINLGKA